MSGARVFGGRRVVGALSVALIVGSAASIAAAEPSATEAATATATATATGSVTATATETATATTTATETATATTPLEPDVSVSYGEWSEAGPSAILDRFADDPYICILDPLPSMPYTVLDPEEGETTQPWLLAYVMPSTRSDTPGGDDLPVDFYLNPQPGDVLEYSVTDAVGEAVDAAVVLCYSSPDESPSVPTGPIVETDQPEVGGDSTYGVIGGALVALGAIAGLVFTRRRSSSEH